MGIYKLNDQEVCLIDSGNGDKAAEEIQNILTQQGWKLKFIINTHTHIDHLGGNRYLMEKWECPAYATNIDNAFANYETLEAAYMYGGYPCNDLNRVFNHPGPIGFLDIEDFDLPEGLEYIRLPGHSFGMIGIKTSDEVWFLADSVLNSKCLEKYQFGYLVDVEGYMNTLKLLQTLEGKLFLPAHGDVVSDIRPLAQGNLENIRKNIDGLLEDCRGGKNFDLILKGVYDRYKMKANVVQNALVGSTLRCYLTYLQDSGRLECYFEDNIMKWKTV
nr:MBL fold metallo-hydrolase [Anaerovorax odorimutans]